MHHDRHNGEAERAWYWGHYFILALALILTVVVYPIAVEKVGGVLLNIVLSLLLAARPVCCHRLPAPVSLVGRVDSASTHTQLGLPTRHHRDLGSAAWARSPLHCSWAPS